MTAPRQADCRLVAAARPERAACVRGRGATGTGISSARVQCQFRAATEAPVFLGAGLDVGRLHRAGVVEVEMPLPEPGFRPRLGGRCGVARGRGGRVRGAGGARSRARRTRAAGRAAAVTGAAGARVAATAAAATSTAV